VLAKWFKGKELSFAFGINLTIARLASVAADNSPTWANRVFYPNGPAGEPSWQGPLLLAVGAGVVAVVCSVIYWALESRAEGRYELGKAGSIDKLEFGQIFRFNSSYWLVVGLCFTFYSAIFPFRTFAIDFFTNKILSGHGGINASEAMRVLAHERAGMFNSLLPLSAMVATPLFGLARRQDREAFFLDDVWLDPVDASLPADGIHQCFALRTRLHDGDCVLPDSGGDVAFGGLYRGPEPARHRLCLNDTDSADWLLHHEPADRQGQRLRPCGLDNPGGYGLGM
jgi:hypothetical protein